MPLYQKRPVEVMAEQWHKHGDLEEITILPDLVHLSIQRRFPTERPRLRELGYFANRDGGVIVAPGDWLVTSATGVQTIVKAAEFAREYLPVAGETAA